jgi:hypothetical protein
VSLSRVLGEDTLDVLQDWLVPRVIPLRKLHHVAVRGVDSLLSNSGSVADSRLLLHDLFAPFQRRGAVRS